MHKHTSIALAALALVLAGCGPSDEEKARAAAEEAREKAVQEASKTPDSIEEAVTELTKAFSEMGENVETIAAKDLKAMLPETVAGMKRVKASASKDGAFGYTVSSAEAVYRSDDGDGRMVTLTINDLGSMQSVARMGLNWLSSEIDEETESGFRRTTEYKGHKAVESYQDSGRSTRGQKSVFVDGRFVVDVTGENVSFDDIEEVVAAVPLDDLEATATRQ